MDILAITIPGAISILGAGFTLAWRLGRLEQKVNDVRDDVLDIKGQLDASRKGYDARRGR
jgi:hypothetical protein